MVNGTEGIFIEKQGYVEAVEHVALSQKSLEGAVRNIARRLGDDISEEKPILDSRLADGSRVAAVIPRPDNGQMRVKMHSLRGPGDEVSWREFSFGLIARRGRDR